MRVLSVGLLCEHTGQDSVETKNEWLCCAESRIVILEVVLLVDIGEYYQLVMKTSYWTP